ncbi:hypothetical protein [Thioalkalivibrio paradoxus]|uniref:hypothetical protein n=1 Tax=Thioalkalivibrio paradoxus TaxID=108010 RepID=UPI00022C5BD0|nr:hypothetical protein [Thioalkalivibrio paradoxus]
MRDSLLWRRLDDWVLEIADRLGVQVSRARPVELRGGEVHPLEAYYRANGRNVVIDVPLGRMRGMGASAFPCHKDSNHPYIRTLIEYECGHVRYAGSALERFYAQFRPANAAEYLGCAPRGSGYASMNAPYEAVLPWEHTDPAARAMSIRRTLLKEQRSRLKSRAIDLDDWHLFGPMSADAGEYAWKRLVGVFQSIQASGYKRSGRFDGDIQGLVLLDDRYPDNQRWCLYVTGGHHRSAVLGALGHETAPVRFRRNRPPIIVRSHAPHWPQVVDGMISLESALCIFDRIMEGRSPPASRWGDP